MSNSNRGTWSFNSHRELFEAVTGEPGSKLGIVRLVPGDSHVEWEWRYDGVDKQVANGGFVADIWRRGEREHMRSVELKQGSRVARIEGLENGIDYELCLRAIARIAGETRTVLSSPVRLVRPGHIPGTVINYIHPEDYTFNFSGRSPASPSIVELPDGRWVASHDVYWSKGGQNLSFIFRSDDKGVRWTYLTALSPCYWGKLFVHHGKLYILATSTECGGLLIGCSVDGGESWSAPTTLIPAGSREEGGPHKAPVPVIAHNGRLWSAIEYGSWMLGGHSAGVVSAAEDADLLDAANWTVSPFLPYDDAWPGTVVGGKPGILEGNVVVRPNGKLINVLRYHTGGGSPNYGRALVLSVDSDNPGAVLQFEQVIHFPTNSSKFTIHHDAVSNKYWSLVNRASSNLSKRNILTLISSDDTINWMIHRDILNYDDNGWAEDSTKVAFQYVDWMFQGEDIAFVSRTSINGAYSYHNANHITFHTIKGFRNL